MGRWNRYWFAEGGRTSVAILRLGIAVAVWLTLNTLRDGWPANAPGAPQPPDTYKPIGIWMLFGSEPPPLWLIDVLWATARVATVAMFVGAFSRVTTALSFVCALGLASLYYSGFGHWSHSHNVVLLAHLAFLGARCGDALSVDALVRRWRNAPPRIVEHGYQWSVRLVQLAVAVMFASGMFHKVMHGAPTLDWALSDNLRHQLLVRFDLADLERTAVASWIIDDVWKYRTAASLNLIAQTMPLVACLTMRWPIVRAAAGMFFVVETAALALVMDLWNLHWLPLALVFVDWDALRRRLRVPEHGTAQPMSPRSRCAISAFVACFVAYDLLTAFVPRIDQKLNTYPFSSFPMFASIRARTPYDTHLPYSLPSGHFEVLARDEVSEGTRRWVNHSYRSMFNVKTRDELRDRMQSMVIDATTWHRTLTGLRYVYSHYDAPAYPAPARLTRRPLATIGEVEIDGAFRSLLGRARRESGGVVVVEPGVPVVATGLELHPTDGSEPLVFEVGAPPWRVPVGNGVRGAFVAVVADTDGQPRRWLIARLAR